MLCPKGSLAIPRLCHWISKTAAGSPTLCHWVTKTMSLDLPDATRLLDPPIYATGSPRLCDATGSPRVCYWISQTMPLDL